MKNDITGRRVSSSHTPSIDEIKSLPSGGALFLKLSKQGDDLGSKFVYFMEKRLDYLENEKTIVDKISEECVSSGYAALALQVAKTLYMFEPIAIDIGFDDAEVQMKEEFVDRALCILSYIGIEKIFTSTVSGTENTPPTRHKPLLRIVDENEAGE